jgi:hypothetical protein
MSAPARLFHQSPTVINVTIVMLAKTLVDQAFSEALLCRTISLETGDRSLVYVYTLDKLADDSTPVREQMLAAQRALERRFV